MPVLVITQTYRPFYYLMRRSDWRAFMEALDMVEIPKYFKIKKQTELFDKMGETETPNTVGLIYINEEELAVVPETYYINIKTLLYDEQQVQ